SIRKRLSPHPRPGSGAAHCVPSAAISEAAVNEEGPSDASWSRRPSRESSDWHSGERNSPHSLSLGTGCASRSRTLYPDCASERAAAEPAGPTPITAASYSFTARALAVSHADALACLDDGPPG